MRAPVAAALAISMHLAWAAEARADVAAPELDGCRVRPPGSPCFVDGVTRGVCAAQVLVFDNGNTFREVVCRVPAPGVDPGAPPPPPSGAVGGATTAPEGPPFVSPEPSTPSSACAAAPPLERAAPFALVAWAVALIAVSRRRPGPRIFR